MNLMIDEILSRKLGPNKKIINIECSKLPPMGVTSVMLKVKVTVQDHEKNEEVLHLVAKTVRASESKTSVRDVVLFKKEAAFYETILPILKEFQKAEGVTDFLEIFAEFYGAKYSEAGDEDSVILLEDVTLKGFSNIDRKIGFDLKYAEKILDDLSRLHGTTIALKIKKPEIFEKNIRSHCSHINVMKANPVKENVFKTLSQLIQTFPEHGYLVEKVSNFEDASIPKTREPYGTLINFDFWVNNIMNKTGKDGGINNVFVDFQIYDYRSPAAEVFFFLWTSVKVEILKQNLDHLLTHYHQSLLNTLEKFKIDTTMFDYKHFEEDMQINAQKYEFQHALLFKCFIMYLNPEHFKINLDEISPEFKEFVNFMVTECSKRKWLL